MSDKITIKEDKNAFFKELKERKHFAYHKLYKMYGDEIFRYIETHFRGDNFMADDVM